MNAIIEQAIAKYNPVRIFAMFSSGNDSIVSTDIAMKNGAHEAVLVNTGIGIPQSREHWFSVCCKQQWTCRMLFPPDRTYREFVLNYGFPGPAAHRYAYSWLKERAIRKLVRDTKREASDRVMLITGVRRSESLRRMGYVEPIVRQGATVWVAPCYDMDTKERDAYMEANGLPRSPVTDLLHISGECMCGSFAGKYERKELELWYPEFVKDVIEPLEKEAKEAGVHSEWGVRPRKDTLTEELPFMPMCASCANKSEGR